MTPSATKSNKSFPILCVMLFIALFSTLNMSAENDGLYKGKPLVALRSNMLYDAALTPDLGVELSMNPRLSLAVEGVWAWWSDHSRNRCWRIYGGWVELRSWLGQRHEQRSLTGHHVGVYGSYHSYDFEFGGKGWQSPQTLGIGVAYGYSLAVSRRLNIDFAIKAGYASGRRISYIPQCGQYVGLSKCNSHYWGVTGLEITLVWFPGRGKSNNPNYLNR
ncbi:MAG: DUF3575 domain-containing protein [Muribaculaceae bacterium]|nr:DUF3575 domain-containing protein [Muribaculaceae bacterium]